MWVIEQLRNGWKAILAISLIYVLMWAVLLPAITDCFVLVNHCSTHVMRSLEPLLGYLSTGNIVHTGDPGQIYTYNPIGYAIVLFALGSYEGERQFLSVILVHAVLMLTIGLLVYAIVAEFFPRMATLAFALTVFNPNALFVAVQPKEDFFFAFFVALAMTAAFAFVRRPGWSAALVCGAAVGLSANFRPTGHYLIYVIPLMLAAFGAFSKTFMHGVLLKAYSM